MKKIRPIGGFFPLDEKGQIVNPCSRAHIPADLRPVLSFIEETYRRHLGERLHSVWLRGSLPRGAAVEGLSDFDTFALADLPVFTHWQEAPWREDAGRLVRERFPRAGTVEWVLNSYRDPLEEHNRRLTMLIATQSMPVCGEDIRPKLPRFRPGPEMMLYYRWLAVDLQSFDLATSFDAAACRDICKSLVRAGLELVETRIGKFTPDLYWCYRAFIRYYPGKTGPMRQMLHYFLNPVGNDDKVRSDILKFGWWLVEEFKRISH